MHSIGWYRHFISNAMDGISIYTLPSIMSLIFQKNVNYEMIRPEHWMALTQSYSPSHFLSHIRHLSGSVPHFISHATHDSGYKNCKGKRTGFTRYHSPRIHPVYGRFAHTKIFVKHMLRSNWTTHFADRNSGSISLSLAGSLRFPQIMDIKEAKNHWNQMTMAW